MLGLFAFQGQNRNLGNATSEIGSEPPFDERDPLRQSKSRRPLLENVLRGLALSTGGEAIFNTGELVGPLDKLDGELSNYYVLGFSPIPVISDTGLRELEVKTTLKEARLKYRKTYAPSRSQERWANTPMESRLQGALESPAPLSQIPVRFETAFFHERGSGDLTNMLLAVKIGREVLQLRKQGSRRICTADVAGVARSLDGRVAGRFTEEIRVDLDASEEPAFRSNDLLYHTSLELRPGTYRLKIAVADDKGKTGTTERVFAVPSVPASALAMSSVVATQQVVQMPGLIQNLQDRLLEETSPLRFRGTEIALPVDLEADRQSSVVLFYKLYNLEDSQQTHHLTASVQLIDLSRQFPWQMWLTLQENIRQQSALPCP
jgi:hypothetical protein